MSENVVLQKKREIILKNDPPLNHIDKHVIICALVGIIQTWSPERRYYFLQPSLLHESHPGSCCYTTVFGEPSPPQPQGLTVSVTRLLRSGQIKFSNRRFFAIFSAPCSDMRLGNWLDLNICMLLNVATESYDSVSSIHRRSEFSTHGCQSDPCFSKGRKQALPAAV